jgi:hypothetical protein
MAIHSSEWFNAFCESVGPGQKFPQKCKKDIGLTDPWLWKGCFGAGKDASAPDAVALSCGAPSSLAAQGT